MEDGRYLDRSSIIHHPSFYSNSRRINSTTKTSYAHTHTHSAGCGGFPNMDRSCRKSRIKKRKSRGSWDDNGIMNEVPTFASKHTSHPTSTAILHNLSAKVSCCTTRSSCGGKEDRTNNVPSLNDSRNGNDDDRMSSIFHTCAITRSSSAFGKYSKGCNEPISPPPRLSSTRPPSLFSSSPASLLLFFLVCSWNLSSTSSFCPPYCSCDDIALSVDCHSASNLRVVPIFLNPQIKFLSLSRNQIKDITMSLQFYNELQVLDISHNKLETLGRTNFESLKSLHLLNVSYNSIKSLDNGVFTGLSHMKVVDLSGNQLERIEREIFWSLGTIKEIILDRNRLEFLDWEMFHGLDTLERISAQFNFIQVIEPSTSLAPVAGGLTSHNANYNSNDNDKHSNTSGNNDNNNMATFGGGRDGGGTLLLPNWTLKNVRFLDLSSNQLTRVKDYGLVIFGALRELNLCCNYIHTLEDRAFVLSSSKPSRKSGLLERLNLSQNRLGRVPTEALEKLGPTLRQLDLSSNRISDHIPKNAFRGLLHLESLRMSDNPEILYIDPDALSENQNLINFEGDYLSNLTEISASLFKNKLFLQNFSLKYASVSSLSPEFFQPPVTDVVGCLDLTGNPIDCNCSAHSFYQFVTDNLANSLSSSVSPHATYEFDQMDGESGRVFRDEHNSPIRENALRSTASSPEGKVNGSNSELSSESNPNLIGHSRSHSPYHSGAGGGMITRNNLSHHNNHGNNRPNLFYVRCQSPATLSGVLMKDLKSLDFQHCFTPDDQVQTMVICIAAGILALIFLTLLIKLCCVCGLFRRLSSFCKTHCSTRNCCQLRARKEKQSSDKLFFDSMTIALRRDMAPGVPPPNFNTNLANGKSILGEHPHLLFCGTNPSNIPLTTSGCIIGGGNNGGAGSAATLGRNGNGNHPITMSMDYDDCFQDDDEDDDDDEEPTSQQQQLHQRTYGHHHSHHLHRGEPMERHYAPVEPPPPIPLQFPNQAQSLSRKKQHQQLLLHHQATHGHQHHSPTMGYSPKHYAHHIHHPHSSPVKHSSLQQSSQQQQQQPGNPPVIVHYEYPDFPSMHRVKQVPSVLV